MRTTIKPANSYVVRKPDGEILNPKGEEVLLNTYWRRRLADGDVLEVTEKKEAKK